MFYYTKRTFITYKEPLEMYYQQVSSLFAESCLHGAAIEY